MGVAAFGVDAGVPFDGVGTDEWPLLGNQVFLSDAKLLLHFDLVSRLQDGDEADAVRRACEVTAVLAITL